MGSKNGSIDGKGRVKLLMGILRSGANAELPYS
jgi:hypothetical protein